MAEEGGDFSGKCLLWAQNTAMEKGKDIKPAGCPYETASDIQEGQS